MGTSQQCGQRFPSGAGCRVHQTCGHLRSQRDGMLARGENDICGEIHNRDGVCTLSKMLPET